jgi:glycosyltransferase involved in cell wall biosynthesis
MMIGLPVVAMATAGISGVVHDGVSGYVDVNPRAIVARMREMLASPGEAWRLGQGARRTARDRFDLRRFVRDWDQALRSVAGGACWLAPRASAGMGVGA